MFGGRNFTRAFAAAALLAGTITVASADHMMGRGMMGNGMMMGNTDMGYGMGMMGPGGHGMMGPGMGMGGCGMMGSGAGMGCGMMGSGMMASGMGMGGCSMMGSGMMGPGMMGMGGLNLDQAQRAQIARIQQDARKKQFDLMAQLDQEQYKLQELYMADKRDPKSIGDQYRRVAEAQRQIMEVWLDSQNRIEGVLTDEQRETLRNWGHGPGMMMHGQRQQ